MTRDEPTATLFRALRMKVLMLAHNVPYPLNDGYNLHNHHYTRLLGARHEIHLFALVDGQQAPPEALAQFAQVHVVKRRTPERGSFLRRLRSLLDPMGLHDFDPAVFAELQGVLAQDAFDAVWVTGDKMLVYSARIDLPVLGDLADDGARDVKSRWKRARSPGQWLRLGMDWFKFCRYQRAALPHVSVCNMVSAEDRDSIRASVPGLEVTVIANGTDSEYFAPRGAPKRPHSLVFEGSMDFPPNAEAAAYFCREILPRIAEREPRVHLTLVGKNPLPHVTALAGERVEVTGSVPDVRPYLERSEVFVSPLVSGSGIKNKVLQAWAMELPVVATPRSAAGLEYNDGLNVLLADEPRAFTDACLRLFADPKMRERLGRAGRETVLEHSTWESKAREMELALERVVQKGRPPGR